MTDLLRYKGQADRGRFSIYEWEGKAVRVYDSAWNTLLLLQLFEDEEVDPLTKEDILFKLLFPDPDAVRAGIQNMSGLLSMLLWELCGLDVDGSHDVESTEKVFDWDQDEETIKASLYQTYARPWEEIAAEVTYMDLIALIGMAPYDTPIGQALYYRTAEPPVLNDHNKDQVTHFYERREYWALKDDESVTSHMEAMNGRATDMFNSLAKLAESNG